MTILTSIQSGTSSGGSWTPDTFGLFQVGVGKAGGVQYGLDSVDGLLISGNAIASISTLTTVGPAKFQIWAHRYSHDDVYATSVFLPEDRSPVLVHEDVALTMTGLVPFTIDMPLNDNNGVRTSISAAVGSNNAKAAFLITWDGADVAMIMSISVDTVGSSFTGLEGPWRAEGRADECPKCGGKSTRDKWVKDGYGRGVMVCPRCWDPENTVGRNRVRSREHKPLGEG